MLSVLLSSAKVSEYIKAYRNLSPGIALRQEPRPEVESNGISDSSGIDLQNLTGKFRIEEQLPMRPPLARNVTRL